MSYNTIMQVEALQRHRPVGDRVLPILNDISFTVEAGYSLAILGPAGSGKSTLLGVLGGIDRPTSGKVFIEGVNISALSEGQLARLRNEKIGLIFQSPNLIPTMTAIENVEAPLYVHHFQICNAHAMAFDMLKQVGLSERMSRFPYQLSGGEQQRVAIARALVCGPDILLADEPTGSLDAETGQEILNLIRQLRNRLGLTVIMVTDDFSVAARADRQFQIINGRIINEEVPAVTAWNVASPHTALTNVEI